MAEPLRIGYALAPKKQQSFIRPSLLTLATSKNINLVQIDPSFPLIQQGPFDCVLHKIYGQYWTSQLQEFAARNPESLIIDSPEAIARLHNRVSMLEAVGQLEVTRGNGEEGEFGVPRQIVVVDHETLVDPSKWSDELKFPVIAKPLVADGSAKSHKMSLVFNQEGLNKLKPPIVLQEFINHGGLIFKVYVVGNYVKCMKRKSLPDVSEEKLSTLKSSLSFSQVSNMNVSEKNDISYCKMMELENAEMPPEKLIKDIALGLRKVTRLHLFNFDVIRDTTIGNRYLIIDINYFPGYAKMPSYEAVLTDFFLDVLKKKDLGSDDKTTKKD